MMSTPFFDYALFGLNLRSGMPLPELPAAAPGAQPDIAIEYGTVPGEAKSHGWPQPIEGGAVFAIDGIARYAVLGDRIIVQPEPGAEERNVRLYLLGSAMGMLLHQRGLLPLHANAVEIDGKAVAFMGPSGAGKSTLAAWFHDRGHRVVADDVCVVRFTDERRPLAYAGLPRLRLWRSALEASGREAENFERSYVGDDSYDKYDLPIARDAVASEPIELAAVYLLAVGTALRFVPLEGADAIEALFANTYRGGFLAQTDSAVVHWQSCVQIVRTTPVRLVEREWNNALFDEQASGMVADARALIAAGGGPR